MNISEGQTCVGTAGWSYDDWKDVVYPSSEKNKLGFVARYLDCVEINTSFYRPVSPRMAEKWVGDVEGNRDFFFTAKLWRGFTHDISDKLSKSDVQVFRDGLKPLKEAGKLLAILVQFPFYFGYCRESRCLLGSISRAFPDYGKILEVRDISWSQHEALEFLKGLDFNVASLDMPLAKGSFNEETIVTGSIGYLRLHGRNRKAWFSKDAGRDEKYDYLYSDEEMDRIVERISAMKEKAEVLVVVWNNHFSGKAFVNSVQTLSRLKGGAVPAPPLLVQAYPQLETIFQKDKGMLF